MEYLVAKFRILCPEGLLQTARDLLADSMAEAGFESFEDTDEGMSGYVQKELFNRDKFDEILSSFPLEKTKISYSIENAENKDWNEVWEQNGFDPIDIDDEIVIVDCNHKSKCQNKDAQLIVIDAKLAFGTGTHETTQMIVSTLLHIDVRGKHVLDCGCGTGILSISALKIGADNAVGYDIDEWSVENTKHNAAINGVENRLSVFHGDASVIGKEIKGAFDIVLANINRNILLHDMPVFKKALVPDGLLILSGFYKNDLPKLKNEAHELGLKFMSQQSKDNWCCAVFKA